MRITLKYTSTFINICNISINYKLLTRVFCSNNNINNKLIKSTDINDNKDIKNIQQLKKDIYSIENLHDYDTREHKDKNNIFNRVKDIIDNKLVTKIIKNNNKNTNNNNQIKIYNSSSIDTKNNFIFDKSQAIDFKNNKLAKSILEERKIDFKDLTIKASNTKDNELNTIYEVNAGKVYSTDVINNLIKSNDIYIDNNNKEYEYNLKLVGKKINNDEFINEIKNNISFNTLNNIAQKDICNTNESVELTQKNDNNSKHFISSFVYKDNGNYSKTIESKYLKISDDTELNNSTIKVILSNPFVILLVLILISYIYPNIWKKENYCELSLRRNNKRLQIIMNDIIANNDNKNLYNYINYRRGLYANVRSNFN